MFYGGNDDDDNDFNIVASAGGSSKLANLFATEQQVAKNEQSLFYVPPKQPKKTEPQSSMLSVIHALALHAYKLYRESGKYISQGKLGAAILGNHQLCMYKFILYTGKKQEVASVVLTPSFVFTVQQNYYVNFYDDHKENWSMVFDSEKAVVEFAKQVALAKANSAGENLKSLIVQDLTPGEGNGLEIGDAVEVAYTGYLVNNHEIGQVFDSSANSGKLLRIKLGKGKVNKALEEGLIGAKKNGRRFLIVPKSFEHGIQGFEQMVPPGATLAFDVTINKVKHGQQQHSRSSTPSGQDTDNCDFRKPDVVPKPTSTTNEDTIRSRGASLSEQLSQSPKSEKAKIISRMAKMGMPMLPLQGATPAQPSSDSETEEDQRSKSPTPAPPREQSPKPSPKPRSSSSNSIGSVAAHHSHAVPPVQQMSLYQPVAPFAGGQAYPYGYQPPGPMASQFTVYPQQPYVNAASAPVAAPVPAPSMGDSHLPLLLSESRSQNTELRMSLSKLTDKVDTVLNKLNEVKADQTSSVNTNMPYMESSVLMSNIQRIVLENSQLKRDLEEKTQKIENLNEKIYDLLQKNQRFMEESHMMMEQRSDTFHTTASQSQARLLSLEQDKATLANELSDAMSKLSALQLEITKHQKREDELKLQLQNASLEVAGQKEENKAVKLEHDKHQQQLNEMEQMVKSFEREENHYKEIIKSLETKLATLEASSESAQKISDVEEKLKEQLEKKYQAKISDLMATHKDEMNSLQEKYQESEQRMTQLESKLRETEASLESNQQMRMELVKEVESLSIWKNKYDNVYKSAQTMKEKYEEKIQQLTSEVRRLKSQEIAGSVSLQGEDFELELKKIMTALYKLLQVEFQKGDSYSGGDVLRVVLEKIRYLTLRLLEGKSKGSQENTGGVKDGKDLPQQTACEKNITEESSEDTEKSTTDASSQPEETVSPPVNPLNTGQVVETQPLGASSTEPTPVNQNLSAASADKPLLPPPSVKEVEVETKSAEEKQHPGGEKGEQEETSGLPSTSEAPISSAPTLGAKDPDLLPGAPSPVSPDTPDDASKKYLFFDNKAKVLPE